MLKNGFLAMTANANSIGKRSVWTNPYSFAQHELLRNMRTKGPFTQSANDYDGVNIFWRNTTKQRDSQCYWRTT